MTRIYVNRADFRIDAEGHADAGRKGEDIVCAGISALMQALLNILIREKDDGYLMLDWTADEERGSMMIHAKPFNWRKPIVRAYFNMTVLGLRAIEQNYRKNIKVIEEGEDEDGNV